MFLPGPLDDVVYPLMMLDFNIILCCHVKPPRELKSEFRYHCLALCFSCFSIVFSSRTIMLCFSDYIASGAVDQPGLKVRLYCVLVTGLGLCCFNH